MACVSVQAREVMFKHRTFRTVGGRPFRLDIHALADAAPGRDGKLSIDGGYPRDFEFLGRGRTASGQCLCFFRVHADGGRTLLLACDARLQNGEVPVGNTRIGFADLSAALPTELPSFVAGTRLRTPQGMRPVEELAFGDLVTTRDGLVVRVVSAMHRSIDAAEEAFDDEARPVVVVANAFAPGAPARDLTLGRRQRVMMCGWRADVMTEFNGVLAPASALVDDETVFRDTGSVGITFVHLILEEAAVVLADGLPVVAPGPDSVRPRGTRLMTDREIALLPLSVQAAPMVEVARPARPPLCPWELTAMARESEQGTWAEALDLAVTVPVSSIETDEPLLVLTAPVEMPSAAFHAAQGPRSRRAAGNARLA